MANEEAAPPAGFTTADLRALCKEVASVRLDGVVGSISTLVRRMRAAGMFLSDRRAVKLQRLAASSAVLSGRRDAIASDLWVARHVWETLEDREEVEEIVDDVLASARDASDIGGRDHPLAFRGPGATELLAAVARLEDELTRLRGIEHRREPSKLRDRLQDLDREVRWCRPRGPEDEHRLREAETRLGSLSESLARGDGGT